MMKHVVVILLLLLLAGCSSDGGSRASSSMLSPSQVKEQLTAIQEQADTVVVSDGLLPTFGPSARAEVICDKFFTCDVVYAGRSVGQDVPFLKGATYESAGRRQGVNLAWGKAQQQNPAGEMGTAVTDVTVYGGWLKHSAFGAFFVETMLPMPQGGYKALLSGSVGTATPEPLPKVGGGMWQGIMVGTDASSGGVGNMVEGNATLTIPDFADPRIDVAFTGIRGVDDNDQIYDPMHWDAIMVGASGFQTGDAGNAIEGRFYGPNHEEIGGVFERGQMVGAFGAQQQ